MCANKTQTHPLLGDATTQESAFDGVESIGLIPSRPPPISFDEDDPDLAPLLSQLQNHLDSIKANAEQLPAIDDEMLKTRAVLRALEEPSPT